MPPICQLDIYGTQSIFIVPSHLTSQGTWLVLCSILIKDDKPTFIITTIKEPHTSPHLEFFIHPSLFLDFTNLRRPFRWVLPTSFTTLVLHPSLRPTTANQKNMYRTMNIQWSLKFHRKKYIQMLGPVTGMFLLLNAPGPMRLLAFEL